MRLRTDFWVGVLTRRAEAAGAYVSIARKGSAEAGAIFVSVNRRDGTFDLYGPAPQALARSDAISDRLFSRVLDRKSEAELRTRMDGEIRFDSDLWLVDIEDRAGRAFVELAAES